MNTIAGSAAPPASQAAPGRPRLGDRPAKGTWAVFAALLIAFGFQFVNGFHDMAAKRAGLQWSTIRNVAMAGVLTLPAAILLSGSLYPLFTKIL